MTNWLPIHPPPSQSIPQAVVKLADGRTVYARYSAVNHVWLSPSKRTVLWPVAWLPAEQVRVKPAPRRRVTPTPTPKLKATEPSRETKCASCIHRMDVHFMCDDYEKTTTKERSRLIVLECGGHER